MQIDLDWVNRIGIILNFLAGFMLAPDLIGRERLLLIESKIEIKIEKLINITQKTLKYIGLKLARESGFRFLAFIILIDMTGIFFIPVFVTSGAILNGILGYCYLILLMLLEFMSFTFYYSPRLTRIIVIKFLNNTKKTVKKIEFFIQKDETVINLLTFWGIIFFIVGNLFQLIASFK